MYIKIIVKYASLNKIQLQALVTADKRSAIFLERQKGQRIYFFRYMVLNIFFPRNSEPKKKNMCTFP